MENPVVVAEIRKGGFDGKNPSRSLDLSFQGMEDAAFAGAAKKVTITAPKGSYAAEFAVSSGYTFKPAK